MKIKAQIVNVEKVSGNSKKDGKPFSFNVVKFLDLESKTSALLNAMIPDVLLVEISAVKGKVHNIACSISETGRITLDAVQAAV
jgi:hypothetical protein